jgi:hypothetical protein
VRRHPTLIILLSLASCMRNPPEREIRESDEPLVNKAVAMYTHGTITPDEFRKAHVVAVVYLPSMTCVGINLKPGAGGTDQTTCFDKVKRLVLTYKSPHR